MRAQRALPLETFVADGLWELIPREDRQSAAQLLGTVIAKAARSRQQGGEATLGEQGRGSTLGEQKKEQAYERHG